MSRFDHIRHIKEYINYLDDHPALKKSNMELNSLFQNKIDLTTPPTLSLEVVEFARSVFPDAQVRFVDVMPPKWSREACCDINVKKMISTEGGSSVLGYKIWMIPRKYIETEAHTIWMTNGFDEVDVTFNPSGESKIAFFSDPRLSTIRSSTDNKVRKALDPYFEEAVEFETYGHRFVKAQIMPDDIAWQRCRSFETWKKENEK